MRETAITAAALLTKQSQRFSQEMFSQVQYLFPLELELVVDVSLAGGERSAARERVTGVLGWRRGTARPAGRQGAPNSAAAAANTTAALSPSRHSDSVPPSRLLYSSRHTFNTQNSDLRGDGMLQRRPVWREVEWNIPSTHQTTVHTTQLHSAAAQGCL